MRIDAVILAAGAGPRRRRQPLAGEDSVRIDAMILAAGAGTRRGDVSRREKTA